MISKVISQSNTLGKLQRLKSRKLIGKLFSEGKHSSAFPIRVIYMPVTASSTLQAGFTVSSRNFKRAVDRNRLKRLMREAYRVQKNTLTTQLEAVSKQMIMFFIYTGREMETFEVVRKKVNQLLATILKDVEPSSLNHIKE